MSYHDSTAKNVRIAKESFPGTYCQHPHCLWNVTRSGPCPKHPVKAQPVAMLIENAEPVWGYE